MPIIGLGTGARLYANLGDVRAAGITTALADDARVNDAIADASRWVEAKTGQTTYGFAQARVATETIRDAAGELLVLPAPLANITAVTPEGGSALDVAAYTLDSPRILRWLRSWSARSVAITGTWGYTSVPALIRQATALYAAHLIMTDPEAEGVRQEQIGNYSRTLGETEDGQSSLYDRAVRALKDGGYIDLVFA